MLTVRFFTALLVNGSSLLNAGIVALELDTGVEWEVEDALHGFAKRFVSYGTRPLNDSDGKLTES